MTEKISVGWIAWDVLRGEPAAAGYRSARKLYKSEKTAKAAIGDRRYEALEVFAEVTLKDPSAEPVCHCGLPRSKHSVRHPFVPSK